ncbi:MAG: lactate utilization protein [Anaerolineae bacterium]|nr:lactate utilization protein [Anaerolineae bacterium]
MPSRHIILKKLRAAQQPFTDIEPIAEKKAVVTVDDTSPQALRQRFIDTARTVKVTVHEVNSPNDALEIILDLIGDEKQILSWQPEHIPLPELHTTLKNDGISIAERQDGSVPVGITGVDAALAATGSLILYSGTGQYRATSLLPDKHIAIMKTSQIVADMETWVAQTKDDFNKPSNITLITGPSKTADIGQELILGAHGPRAVHIILLPS